MPTTEELELTSCIRRATQSIDKRFCFDITAKDRYTMLSSCVKTCKIYSVGML